METARLMFRDLSSDDIPDMVRILNNFNVTQHTSSYPYPYAQENAVAFLAEIATMPKTAFIRALVLKAAPETLIGAMGIYHEVDSPSAELGYWLAETAWGQGLATEAAHAMVAHAFSHLGHHTITASYDNGNPASGRVLHKLGFTATGPIQEFSMAQGKLTDGTNTMLTREQWLAQTLEASRLSFRALDESDIPTLLRELNNFNITRNTARIPYPYGQADAEAYLKRVNESPSGSLVRALVIKTQPATLIGVVGIHHDGSENPAELGYWFSETIWGQGFATEAASAAVNFAFRYLPHDALIACYHNDNPASGRILEKLGFATLGQCLSFSMAQGKDVAVTNTKLTRSRWQSLPEF
jgi:RimJ/RimL family protein N-acetyltransferase